MEYQDYYAVLGVPRTASQAEIKKAFRKAARTHHPDTNKDDAAAEHAFKAVNEANAVLSDPKKRELYDRLGKDWEAYARAGATAGAGARGGAAGGPFAGFGGSGPGGVRYEFRTSGEGGDFSDFFNAFFSGDLAGDPNATGPGRGRRPTGGATFEDILAGMGLSGAAAGSQAGSTASSRRATECRGRRRDRPGRGVPRHDPPGRGRWQAPRSHHPQGRRYGHAHPAGRQGPGWRRPVRRRAPDP